MASKVLVTGGTGLLGRRLPNNSGLDFFKIGSSINLLENRGVEKVLSLANSYGCDAVLHMAWTSNSKSNYEVSPENILWAEKSIELAKKCVERGMFFAGIGTGLENDSSNTTPYVLSKRQVRTELLSELSLGLAGWLRPYYIFDIKECRPRLLKFVLDNSQDNFFVVNNGNSLHDYISSFDVSSGILEALRINLSGTVDIGSGKLISNRFFLQLICEELGIPVPKILSNSTGAGIVANLSAISETGWRPTLTEQFLKSE
jgi:nucleoside-diphosphate-sugar epimerase